MATSTNTSTNLSQEIKSLQNKEGFIPLENFYKAAAVIAESYGRTSLKNDAFFNKVYNKLGEYSFSKRMMIHHKPDNKLANKLAQEMQDLMAELTANPADPNNATKLKMYQSKQTLLQQAKDGYDAIGIKTMACDEVVNIAREKNAFIFQTELARASIREFNVSLPENKPNAATFVKTAEDVLPNASRTSLGTALTSLRKFIENITVNIAEATGIETEAKNTSIYLKLFSAVGGTGKGYFINHFQKYLESKNIPVAHHSHNMKWLDPSVPQSIVSINPEAMLLSKYDSAWSDTVSKKNSLVDNTDVIIEMKGLQPEAIKSRTTLIEGSNFKTDDQNNRREALIEFNECSLLDVDSLNESSKEYLHLDWTQEDWNNAFDRLFESCPFGKNFTSNDVIKNNSWDLDELIMFARENQGVAVEDVTPKEFANLISENKGYDAKQRKALVKCFQNEFTKLARQGLIKASKPNPNPAYSRYNLSTIANLRSNEDEIEGLVECDVSDVDGILALTKKAYEDIIRSLEPTDPEPTKKIEVKPEVKAEPVEDIPARKPAKKGEPKPEGKPEGKKEAYTTPVFDWGSWAANCHVEPDNVVEEPEVKTEFEPDSTQTAECKVSSGHYSFDDFMNGNIPTDVVQGWYREKPTSNIPTRTDHSLDAFI